MGRKSLIVIFLVFISSICYATVPVKNAYTNVPVSVCTPLDSSANCTIGNTGIAGYWTSSSNNIYNNNAGNVGIGTANPTNPLQVSSSSGTFSAGTGGTITTYYSAGVQYKVHTFTTNGTFVAPTPATNITVLALAGGGGGGYNEGGGGAAGGRLYYGSESPANGAAIAATAAQSFGVTIGDGGAGGTSSVAAVSGSDTVFGSYTATGGGRGSSSGNNNAANGGSGGGASRTGGTAGTGTSGQGYDGGIGTGGADSSGGGGGAGGLGGNGASAGATGAGGAGSTYTISGSSVCYAGGGSGGSYTAGPTIGTVTCGGGAGVTTGTPNAGTANRGAGGGGGGGSGVDPNRDGGSGGSGVVIVSYVVPGLYAVASFMGTVGINNATPVSNIDSVAVGNTANTSSMNLKNSSGTSMLFVNDAGNVGIGSTTPGTVLDVNGVIRSAGSSTAAPAYVNTTGNNTTGIAFPAANTVAFSTNALERMRVDSSGNVGIATTLPSTLFKIGATTDGASPMYGHMSKFKTYAQALTAQEITLL